MSKVTKATVDIEVQFIMNCLDLSRLPFTLIIWLKFIACNLSELIKLKAINGFWSVILSFLIGSSDHKLINSIEIIVFVFID